MKERYAKGLLVHCSSEVILIGKEDLLFSSGVLGDDSLLKLLRKTIYMVGLHCALRGGIEHNKLRRPGFGSQLKIDKNDRGIEWLVYQEDPLQKTNQGGLLSKNANKVVYVYPSGDHLRCPLYYFKKYIGFLPTSKNCAKLYLHPKKNFSPKVWYCDQPYGFSKIKTMVREVCKEAGLEGKFTYHTLRATCASRIYQNDVLEQFIKEAMGHRSDCVRYYKQTSDNFCETASKTLSRMSFQLCRKM